MAIHESRLTRSESVADGTMAFHFERPPGFTFEAGQNLLLTLADPPKMDSAGASRTFTIASAPHEPELMIATRMRNSTFKQTLKSAAAGLPVTIDGPAGTMTLHEDAARPAVFLAGGIGVTPFLSMARHAAHTRLPHDITLFYSSRRPTDAAFLRELRTFEQRNPKYKLVATMTEAGDTGWTGETGFIDAAMLRRHLPDVLKPVYYLAGPPAMAMSMQSMLEASGVSDDDIRSEEFYGY